MAVLNLRPIIGGLLLRGSQPFGMDADATKEFLRGQGIQSVVDLRVEYERQLLPWSMPPRGPSAFNHGVELIENPLDPLTATRGLDLIRTAEDLGELYLGWARARPDWVADAIRPAAQGKRTLIHCSLGKDRTGVVAAVALLACGADRSAVVADYVATAAELPQLLGAMAATWRAAFPGLPDEAFSPDLMLLQCPDAAIEFFLDGLGREFGDAADYLREGGLTGTELDVLRRELQA
jgi:protein-tyrosine phosphatase